MVEQANRVINNVYPINVSKKLLHKAIKKRRKATEEEFENLLCAFASSSRLCVKLLLAGCGGLRVIALRRARIALTDTCRFTAQSAQVVKFGSSYAASLYKVDVVDDGCVQWENSFNADAKTGLAHGDRLTRSPMFACDYDAFKSLQSLFGLRFLNPDVNTNGVAWLKLWNIITQLRLFNSV